MTRCLLSWVTAMIAWTLLLQNTFAQDECSCERQNMLENDINDLLTLNADLKNYIKNYCPATSTTETTSTTTLPTTTPVVNPCPHGYLKLTDEDFCYKVITERLSWSEGQARCRKDHPHSHLTYVYDSDQNDEIVKYLLTYQDLAACRVPKTDYTSFSTCGQRRNPKVCNAHNEFSWVSASGEDETLSFTYWKHGEPNCYSGLLENCLQYRCEKDNFGYYNCWWNDYVCSSKVCPLCQLEIVS